MSVERLFNRILLGYLPSFSLAVVQGPSTVGGSDKKDAAAAATPKRTQQTPQRVRKPFDGSIDVTEFLPSFIGLPFSPPSA